MLLTDSELRELTGYAQKAKQQTWLADNGYEFDVRSDGRPNVLRAQVVERQCKANKEPAGAVPNFEAVGL